jgi:DNA-binding transcriptional regulator YhcF (GntR family)
MIYRLGPRARRVYLALRDRIARGDLVPGSRLPSHRELAVEFGVAPLTVRQVLSHLEEQGLVSRQPGRGTFVLPRLTAAVLILSEQPSLVGFLAEHIRQAGYRTVAVSQVADALAILADDPTIALALTDLRLPTPTEGAEVVAAIRVRWPRLPLAAIVTDLEDLAPLFGTTAWPLHVIPKPIQLGLLDELLRLVSRRVAPAD